MLEKKIKKIKKEYRKKSYLVKREYRLKCLSLIINTKQVWYYKKVMARYAKQLAANRKKSNSYVTAVCLKTGHQKSRVNWGKLSRFAFKAEADTNSFTNLKKKSK